MSQYKLKLSVKIKLWQNKSQDRKFPFLRREDGKNLTDDGDDDEGFEK